MFSRALGILVAPWLPCLALMLHLSPFHVANALVAGLAATVMSAFSMVHDRARLGVAVIGAWVAFVPFFVRSSLLEMVISGCWGVTMFMSIGGPFSQTPQVTWVRAAARPATEDVADEVLARAA